MYLKKAQEDPKGLNNYTWAATIGKAMTQPSLWSEVWSYEINLYKISIDLCAKQLTHMLRSGEFVSVLKSAK